jgi:hypothetical protein
MWIPDKPQEVQEAYVSDHLILGLLWVYDCTQVAQYVAELPWALCLLSDTNYIFHTYGAAYHAPTPSIQTAATKGANTVNIGDTAPCGDTRYTAC